MTTIAPITLENILLFKTVRLRALEDSPYAFGSTYARESPFSDDDWKKRLERWDGENGAGFLAIDGGTLCGMAGCLRHPDDRTQADLVSLWTSPTHRKQGVGRLLVHEVLRWAQGRSVGVLLLMVTSNNQPAIRFYERLGFTPTGRTEPYPHDPAVLEFEMSRPVPEGIPPVPGPYAD